jgi:hypothetical protein
MKLCEQQKWQQFLVFNYEYRYYDRRPIINAIIAILKLMGVQQLWLRCKSCAAMNFEWYKIRASAVRPAAFLPYASVKLHRRLIIIEATLAYVDNSFVFFWFIIPSFWVEDATIGTNLKTFFRLWISESRRAN